MSENVNRRQITKVCYHKTIIDFQKCDLNCFSGTMNCVRVGVGRYTFLLLIVWVGVTQRSNFIKSFQSDKPSSKMSTEEIQITW